MKWKNKGHEFDEFVKKISPMYCQRIYVFGAGELGLETGKSIDAFGLLGGYIDNDENKQGKQILGKRIVSLKDYVQNNGEKAIVVAASSKNVKVITKQLEENNFVHGKDFFFNNEFKDKIFPLITVYYFNKIYMRLAQITLTERCSLKCKKCAHACYNVDSSAEDMSLSNVYKSVDIFFSKVDYITEFVLIGGEPLLYKKLSQVISYIGDKYREQMCNYCITTNGTIIPSDEVLKECKKYQVMFRISDYTKSLPRLKENHKKLIMKLEKYGIEYRMSKEDGNWIDYGFDYLEKDMNEKELINTFDHCLTPCREIRDEKLYFCVMARSVSDNLHFNEGIDDYLDLEKLEGENWRKIFQEFNLGYSWKGYLDMCHRCHGMDAEKYPIPIAEQV